MPSKTLLGSHRATGDSPSGGGAPGIAAVLPVDRDLLPRFHLLDQLFIFRALILRQIRISYRKTRVGFIMVFIQPGAIMILHIFLFIMWSELTGQPMAAGIPIELFVIVGFTIWFIFSHIGYGPKHAVGEGAGAKLMPLVTPMHFRIAAAAWEFLAMTTLCFIGIILSQMIHGDEPVPDIPAAVLTFVIAAVLGFGIRLVLDALTERWPAVHSLKKLIFRVLFITAGVYFSAVNLHRALGYWVLYNPLIHLLESARHALYPGYPVFEITLWYPTIWAFGVTLAGLVLNRCAERWKID
jgi:capsular polysaccharide transport system permease protein